MGQIFIRPVQSDIACPPQNLHLCPPQNLHVCHCVVVHNNYDIGRGGASTSNMFEFVSVGMDSDITGLSPLSLQPYQTLCVLLYAPFSWDSYVHKVNKPS